MFRWSWPKKFLRDDYGGTTIEFLFWFPIMVMMLTLVTDATLLMHQQQDLYNAARDASRQVALGQKNEEEAASLLVERIDATEDDVTIEQTNGFVTTYINVPFSRYAKVSGFFINGELSAQVTMWVENYES